MNTRLMKKHLFYGTIVISEKGQVVIPVKARRDMAISKGEQLLVFGVEGEMVILSKVSNIAKFAAHLENQLNDLKKIIKSKKK